MPSRAPSKTRYVLGISALYHDSAAALLRDGRVVAAAQEERFSRVKGDARLPRQAARYCLREAGITVDQVDALVFYEKPWLHLERLLDTWLSEAPRGVDSFVAAMPIWLKERARMTPALRRAFDYQGTVLYTDHHEAHAAAAFFPSPFQRAAFLTVDGVGEWTTTRFGRAQGRTLTPLGELHFPHSLGLLYAAITAYLGFGVNRGEYKVMGLAPYGEPRFLDALRERAVELGDDGALRLHPEFFCFTRTGGMTTPALHALLGGPPRRPEEPLEGRHHDVARSLQALTEEAILRMARHVRQATGEHHLVLGGGVALNAVANGKLRDAGVFDDLWVQPAAADGGSAMGAALAAWHGYFGKNRPTPGEDAMAGCRLGPSFDDAFVTRELTRWGAKAHRLEPEELAERAAERLAQGATVALFAGRMEMGPRALGARSILADPRDASMRERLNRTVKRRESFRPFAPAVLEEHASRLFERDAPAPFMVEVARTKDGSLPATTHVDGTARLQTVDRTRAPELRRILEAFERRTGCPALVNTSFNVRGEPIVCSPYDAWRCFRATDLDVLILGNHWLLAEEQPPYVDPGQPADEHVAARRSCRRRRRTRRRGATLSLLLLLAGLVSPAPWGWSPLVVAMIVSLGSALAPSCMAWPLGCAARLGRAVAKLQATLLLGLIFYLVLTPVGLLRRVLGRDPLRQRRPAAFRPPHEDERGPERYRARF